MRSRNCLILALVFLFMFPMTLKAGAEEEEADDAVEFEAAGDTAKIARAIAVYYRLYKSLTTVKGLDAASNGAYSAGRVLYKWCRDVRTALYYFIADYRSYVGEAICKKIRRVKRCFKEISPMLGIKLGAKKIKQWLDKVPDYFAKAEAGVKEAIDGRRKKGPRAQKRWERIRALIEQFLPL